MKLSDYENIELTDSEEDTDARNKEFYSRFPFPWPPITFPRLQDPQFETRMLNQSVGDWSGGTIPEKARIWVAGCGTNQAVYTGLRFPQAIITASDLSTSSLEIASKRAKQCGVSNVSFRQESVNKAEYEGEFDYILCTGVIHHTANPEAALARLSRALKRTGVLELMVYNRYHRTFTTAMQKVVRLFGPGRSSAAGELDEQLKTVKTILATGPVAPTIRDQLQRWHEAAVADHVLQPVEYSYTVESLADMAGRCDLELRLPCFNQFNKANQRIAWNVHFSDPTFQQRYAGLPDVVRWQITNLLLLENSPMLWFYLQRSGESKESQLEWRICEEFLERKFVKSRTALRNYVRQPNHDYQLAPSWVPYPVAPENERIRAIVDAAAGDIKMKDILKRMGADLADCAAVNEIRIETTTSLYPYLEVVR